MYSRARDLLVCLPGPRGVPACAEAVLGEKQRHRWAAGGGRAQETCDGRTAARAQHSARCKGTECSL